MTTARVFVALIAGVIFGFGLSLSGMVDPRRVLGFLDIGSGHWDPTLMFVLGGAVIVAAAGVAWQRRMAKPLLDDRFHLPETTKIDRPLIVGSAIFGLGWGLTGFCPGPAISALALALPTVFVFVAAMSTGALLHDRLLAGADAREQTRAMIRQ